MLIQIIYPIPNNTEAYGTLIYFPPGYVPRIGESISINMPDSRLKARLLVTDVEWNFMCPELKGGEEKDSIGNEKDVDITIYVIPHPEQRTKKGISGHYALPPKEGDQDEYYNFIENHPWKGIWGMWKAHYDMAFSCQSLVGFCFSIKYKLLLAWIAASFRVRSTPRKEGRVLRH